LQAARLHLAPHNPHAQSRRLGVAVVDDDLNDRFLLQRSLARSREFYCAGCYADGEAAINALPSIQAQAVLLDIRLPRMSGISCAQRLKQLLGREPRGGASTFRYWRWGHGLGHQRLDLRWA